MSALLPALIAVALLATLAALVFGVFTMARGGRFNARNSNHLMRLRVALQFAAVLLVAAAFALS